MKQVSSAKYIFMFFLMFYILILYFLDMRAQVQKIFMTGSGQR